jgi:hypothetical protein
LIKQLAPEDTLLPHVLVSAKSFASVPLIVMPVIVTVELPLFVSVIVLARLLAAAGHIAMVFGLRHPQGAARPLMRRAVQYVLNKNPN